MAFIEPPVMCKHGQDEMTCHLCWADSPFTPQETSMSANEHQVGGDHYHKRGALQQWDVIAMFGLDFFLGNVFKYVSRCGEKEGEDQVECLLKARHYLDKKIELLQGKPLEEAISFHRMGEERSSAHTEWGK